MNLQGTRMTFSTEGMDRLWWLMTSPDGNAVRSVLTVMDLEGWRDDLPRLAAGALGRMRQGHWDTTTANAWGVLAMDRFSARYEKTPVGGTTQAALNGKTRTLDWQQAAAGGTLSFDWPTGRETIQVTHSGLGTPWATIRATAALRPTKPFSRGFQVTRTVTKLGDHADTAAVSARTGKHGGSPSPFSAANKDGAAKFNVGDIVRVRLDMEAQSDMTWVVINDPIPAGASILRTGLGGDSLLAAAGGENPGLRPGGLHRAFPGGLPRLLRVCPQGEVVHGIHPAPQQRRGFPAAPFPAGGPLRPGDVWRNPHPPPDGDGQQRAVSMDHYHPPLHLFPSLPLKGREL
jgi:hypothetical protein